jgi:Bacterial Ig-like domain (group 3)/Peptidase family M28
MRSTATSTSNSGCTTRQGSQTWQNVVFTLLAQVDFAQNQQVIFLVHYDTISESAANDANNAPGADDAISGGSALLEAMRLFKDYAWQYPVKFLFVSGEEVGLCGSTAYTRMHPTAPMWRVLNMDQTAFDGNKDGLMNLYNWNTTSCPSCVAFGDAFVQANSDYGNIINPTKIVRNTTKMCQTDHCPFWNVGVTAIDLNEDLTDNDICPCFDQFQTSTCRDTVTQTYPVGGTTLMFDQNYSWPTEKAAIASTALPLYACPASGATLSATTSAAQVQLTWPDVPPVTNYVVERANGGCGGAFTGIASTTTASYTDNTVTVGSTYGYRVRTCPFQVSNCVSEVVQSATTTTLSSSPNPSTSGQSVTFTATVTGSGGVPAGMVTFAEGSTVLASNVPVDGAGHAAFSTTALAVGSHNLTATFTGTTGWLSSSGSDAGSPQVVNQATVTTTTTLLSSPNPSIFSQQVTFTSTTTSNGGVPAGAVAFTEGATVWASNVPVDGAGHASFSTPSLVVGSHTLTATFTGTNGWPNSSGNAAPQVVKTVSTTTSVSSSTNPSVFSQAVTFTAAVTPTPPGSGVPTGTVTFKDGATPMGTGTLDGTGHATFTTSTLALGSHSITAVYSGSTNFNTSTSAALIQTVNNDSTTTTVTSSPDPSVHNQSVTFTATVAAQAPGTATPTGTVTFKDGNRTLGTSSLNAGQASFSVSNLSKGTHPVTAVYGGSSGFVTSTSPTLPQTVN